MNILKIAVPTDGADGLTGRRSDHFGHCKHFTLVDIENGNITGVTALANDPHEAGGCLKPVGVLKEQQVDTIVVGGMGAKPFQRFAEAGIKVFFADRVQCPDVESAVNSLLNGKLAQMNLQQLCKGSGNCHH